MRCGLLRPHGHSMSSPASNGSASAPGGLDAKFGRRLLKLAAAQFEDRRRRVRLALGLGAADAHLREFQRQQFVLDLGDPRSEQRIVEQRAPFARTCGGVLLDLGQPQFRMPIRAMPVRSLPSKNFAYVQP